MVWTILLIVLGLAGFAFLIKKFIPERKLGDWANVSTIVGAIATAFSILWAAYTYNSDVQLQRELAGHSIYQEHMRLSIENPDLANAELAPKPPKPDDSTALKEAYEKYRWYIGHALYSFESILEALPDDKEWENTFQAFIIRHKEYIGDSSRFCERYSQRIIQLIEDGTGKSCDALKRKKPAG